MQVGDKIRKRGQPDEFVITSPNIATRTVFVDCGLGWKKENGSAISSKDLKVGDIIFNVNGNRFVVSEVSAHRKVVAVCTIIMSGEIVWDRLDRFWALFRKSVV